jgi:hypothetical protein
MCESVFVASEHPNPNRNTRMKSPHEMNAYQIIIHEYALEARDRDDTDAAYDEASEKMMSDDELFRTYCREADMPVAEIEAALALK